MTIGKNINASVSGSTLTLVIDLSKSLGTSKSGKSTLIATTSGNQRVPGVDATIGLNLYR